MERIEGIKRLSSLEISKNARDYLVMYYLIADLKNVIFEYAKGDVLDVGCGNKPYEILFNGLSTKYIGCDVVQSSDKKVDFLCPATELAFPDKHFDTIFTTQVIEHVGDPNGMCKELFRVLKQDGVLIISAPFSWELHEEPYDFFRFTKYGLIEMLTQKGFKVISVKANGGKWAAIVQLFLNIIYSTFKQKSWRIKCLKFLFLNCRFTRLLNLFAISIDRKFHDELLTLNYVVVANKT